MALIGVFSGLLFVPLNALIQWRAPDDRRGAVIALANMLVNVGMLAGSVLALSLAGAGFSAEERSSEPRSCWPWARSGRSGWSPTRSCGSS